MMQTVIVDQLKRRGQLGRRGKQYGDKRDLYNVLGYIFNPLVEDYWQLFLRQDLAKRIVKAAPIATWRNPPVIQETANPTRETEFEKAVDTLIKRINLWSYFKRVDVLAGIGYYGVLLLGVNRGNLETQIQSGAFRSPADLLFLSAFSQRHAQVKNYDDNPNSPNYGKPLSYTINMTGDIASQFGRTATAAYRPAVSHPDQIVHASRVMHWAEDLTEDEVNGTPRLEPVLNRLFDIEKVAGGSAEMYWRGAYGGFALEVAEGATSAFAGAGEIDPNVVDEWAHGMRRWIDLEGYKLKEIQGRDVKPAEVFQVLVQLVSACTNIPQRILFGSERGSLASTEDEQHWNDFIVDRRTEYATPKVREFVDRMISWGVLPAPGDRYEVVWPDVASPNEKDRAATFRDWALGIQAVSPAGAPDLVISPSEVRTKFLGLPATPEADNLPDIPLPEPMPGPAPAAPGPSPIVNSRNGSSR